MVIKGPGAKTGGRPGAKKGGRPGAKKGEDPVQKKGEDTNKYNDTVSLGPVP